MSSHYDTIIIGAGPAGMAAAITLQKNGISNAVIDKSFFPRNKVCGGLVTYKTLETVIELTDTGATDLISDVFCDTDRIIELYFKNERLTCSEVDIPLYFVRREKFDFFLVKKYKENGGILFEGEKNYTVDFENKTITLGNGGIITFNYLLIADGALSPNAKKLGIKRKNTGFCIEAHIPKGDVSYPGGVKIFFGIVKKGYAWCFPSGNDICVGLGGVYSKSTDYKSILDGLLKQLGADTENTKYKGAFVPYGSSVDQSHCPDNIILLGDAAGFVDPIYGEGLYFALTSGIEAAGAYISAVRSSDSLNAVYYKKTEFIVKTIKKGNRLKNIFFSHPVGFLFKRRIKNKDFFVRFYCDRQISKYGYDYSRMIKLYSDYRKEKRLLKQ